MERWRAGNVNLKRQSRERGDDLLRFHRDGDDLQDEIDDITFVARFGQPFVRVVDDSGILVDSAIVALY